MIKESKYFIFKKDSLLIKSHKDSLAVPTSANFDRDFLHEFNGHLLTSETNTKCYFFDVDENFLSLSNYDFVNLRECRDFYLDDNYILAIQGLHILNWSRKHKFCGVCGTKFSPLNADRSKTCPSCNNLLFPQTSQAVITGILRDGKILLAHNTNFPEGLYSLIAGFVELGETLEDAVAREIMEEVGLKVKNIRYFASQPWPFPNSMMIGFLADYDSGEIETDNIEIETADWYLPEDFPEIPHHFSIARQIIEYYKKTI